MNYADDAAEQKIIACQAGTSKTIMQQRSATECTYVCSEQKEKRYAKGTTRAQEDWAS